MVTQDTGGVDGLFDVVGVLVDGRRALLNGWMDVDGWRRLLLLDSSYDKPGGYVLYPR